MTDKIDVSNYKIPVEVWSRVVGYFRPLHDWNLGKREEFRERKPLEMRVNYHDSISQKNH